MAKSPKKNRVVVYPKQWPDTRVDKPVIDRETTTPEMGHERNRMGNRFSEQTERPKSARETFSKRFRLTRAKHMPHPAPIRGGEYRTTPQMEKPHYEETEMTGKTYTEFVTEAKKAGRPKKLKPGEEADTLHLQDQLNKLTHPNHVEVHFKDDSRHNIPREHANMALHHFASLKPIDRGEHTSYMSKSHSNFYHVLSKKSIPSKKRGITLAGPRLRKEEVEQVDEASDKPARGEHSWPTRRDKKTGEWGWANSFKSGHKSKEAAEAHAKMQIEKDKRTKVKLSDLKPGKVEESENDDGWYAHKEMHGKDAISREDWKKGVRLNSKGQRVQTKKEEVEQVDEARSRGIAGVHAKTGSMAINKPAVGYKGKQKKVKVQKLRTEANDYAPMETGKSLVHGQDATVAAKTRRKGGARPEPAKDKYMTKEELEIYEALSDRGRELFDRMNEEQRAHLVDTYLAKR